MSELLQNIDKLHTTAMGIERIKKNLGIDVPDVVDYCKGIIQAESAVIDRKGKNWYATLDNTVITVNAHSHTIITAHRRDLWRNK